jgi:protein-L-isoaspartate(D-aspartate) O-methyltransferase
VLDVGTGSGYAAAVLDELAASVVSIERIPCLAGRARRRSS